MSENNGHAPHSLSPELIKHLNQKRPDQNWLDDIRIRELMHTYRIRQTDIAAVMGVNQAVVSRWLTGKRPISDKQLKLLSYHFGKSPEWLVGLDNPEGEMQS